MKFPKLLPGIFTLLLCFCVSEMNAQCQKQKSSCSKSRTEKSNNDTSLKKSNHATYRYYNASSRSAYKQCNKQRYSYHCNKNKSENSRKKVRFDKNYTGVLAGVAFLDDDNASFSTGAEYTRFLNRSLGIGVSAETTIGDDANVMIGLPVSLQLGKRVRLLASPLGAFQQNEVIDRTVPIAADDVALTKEWNSDFGARVGAAYYLTTKGVKIAPMIRADIFNGNVQVNYGITAGLGF